MKRNYVTNKEINSEVLENKKSNRQFSRVWLRKAKETEDVLQDRTQKQKLKGDAGDGLMPHRYGNRTEGRKEKGKRRTVKNMNKAESCTDWGR